IPPIFNSLLSCTMKRLLKMGGINHLGPVRRFWEYDFATQKWTQNEDIPFSFYRATSVSLDSEELIVTNTGQVWTYNYSSKRFSRKNDYTPQSDEIIFVFKEDNQVYLATYGATLSYDFQSDTWEELSKNNTTPNSSRPHALGFYANGNAYILQNGAFLYKYSKETNNWILSGKYPGCGVSGLYPVVFVIEDTAYIAATWSSTGGCAPLMFAYRD
ncbi:MAG: hypothetical protein AAFO69_07950, partial [Bacteroidota bacterium]